MEVDLGSAELPLEADAGAGHLPAAARGGALVDAGQRPHLALEAAGEDEYHITGMLYSLTKPLARTGKPGPEWNTMEITLDGPRTIVVLNGTKVSEYTEGDAVPERKFNFEPQRGTRPNDGYIGLQNHSDKDIVFFKEVAVKMLKK